MFVFDDLMSPFAKNFLLLIATPESKSFEHVFFT